MGRFRIFETVKKVIPTLKPIFMDEGTLLRHKAYCDYLEDSYSRQLARLLEHKEYETVWPVIKVMLKEGSVWNKKLSWYQE